MSARRRKRNFSGVCQSFKIKIEIRMCIDQCYTVRELSNKLKVSQGKILSWVDEGKIKILALPRTSSRRIVRITEPAFREFLENNKKEVEDARNGIKTRKSNGGDYFTI